MLLYQCMSSPHPPVELLFPPQGEAKLDESISVVGGRYPGGVALLNPCPGPCPRPSPGAFASVEDMARSDDGKDKDRAETSPCPLSLSPCPLSPSPCAPAAMPTSLKRTLVDIPPLWWVERIRLGVLRRCVMVY